MKKKGIPLIGLALIIIVLILVFKPSSENTTPIKIGVLKHESSLPIYIADELGFFLKHGVQVELVEVPPGDHMPALLSDRVDILSPTSFTALFGVIYQHPGVLYAVFPGAEIKDGPTVYGFIVAKNFSGKSVHDLTSGIVMAINPYTQVNIRTILSSAGIPIDRWPEIRVANREVALKAVSDGTAIAAIMDQPALAVAISSEEFRLLEANPRARYIGSPYWSGAGAVKQTVWEERHVDFEKLMASIDEALSMIRTDPAAAHRILAKRLGIKENVALQMGGYFFPTAHEIVPLEGIQATIKALVEANLLDDVINVDDFFPPGIYGR